MRQSAESNPARPPSAQAAKQSANKHRAFLAQTRKLAPMVALGLLSALLYDLLYQFNGELTALAQATHAGHKGAFFIPVIIALVFSLVHGLFTGKFWETLGIKPKKS